ncbi:Uncharacterized protein Fot_10901 [Forsythia ovata]|uniref:Uncharacterized protein n=1 Tax=Forsythia ovata TaxID=205694 RepID=A0ABD1WI55_9LAMI
MEHQTPEGSNQPHFIIPHIQGPNPSHELCPLPEELSANIGVNFSSSATTEAHWAHLQLLASQQSQQALLGTLYSSISPFDVARSSHLRSGEILAENIELSQSQSPALMLDISQNQYLLQAAQVPNNNNALFPVDQFTQNTCSTNETLNTYHLPLSTLPPEFRVPSSSRFSGQQLHPQVSMPLGNISDLRLMNADIAHAQGISYPVRSQGIQGHPNLAAGSNSSNLDGGSSSYSLYPLVSGQKGGPKTGREGGTGGLIKAVWGWFSL